VAGRVDGAQAELHQDRRAYGALRAR
jgi:hypothetical protein